MLKKLAKYGNSTTLVIDKAILELLNMDETSIVKLHTDGKSLTITPVYVEVAEQDKKVSYEPYEAMEAAKQAAVKNMLHKDADTAIAIKSQQEFKTVFEKHAKAFTRFNSEVLPNPSFQAALAELTQNIDPTNESELFRKEFNLLKIQFCPEMAEFQNDIDVVLQKYSSLE